MNGIDRLLNYAREKDYVYELTPMALKQLYKKSRMSKQSLFAFGRTSKKNMPCSPARERFFILGRASHKKIHFGGHSPPQGKMGTMIFEVLDLELGEAMISRSNTSKMEGDDFRGLIPRKWKGTIFEV